jgi:hypothetical protein
MKNYMEKPVKKCRRANTAGQTQFSVTIRTKPTKHK